MLGQPAVAPRPAPPGRKRRPLCAEHHRGDLARRGQLGRRCDALAPPVRTRLARCAFAARVCARRAAAERAGLAHRLRWRADEPGDGVRDFVARADGECDVAGNLEVQGRVVRCRRLACDLGTGYLLRLWRNGLDSPREHGRYRTRRGLHVAGVQRARVPLER